VKGREGVGSEAMGKGRELREGRVEEGERGREE